MAGLGPRGIARHLPALAEAVELGVSAGEQLVDVGLVARVPEDGVPGTVEHPVEGQRQLHGPEVGTQVAAGATNRLHDPFADLGGQAAQFVRSEVAQVIRGPD